MILDKLSFKTTLGKSLKNTLRKFKKNELINDLENYIDFLNDNVDLLQNYNYRIKSLQSILLKYDKYYPSKEVYGCFNDILGIRVIVDSYNNINLDSELVRCVDMTKGKSNDDGYRGYHIYYRRSNYHYPIEIQFFTNKDFKFNIWLHTYVYKYKDNDIGVKLRKMYDSDKINDKKDFERCLEYVLFNSKRF
ncbi:hypothetical protein [Clostridium rectalis]|uniref:hypothetical protein n=1 Tax=Clostridium rectalis TaxID=2040295 RepID=UPI000F62E1E3|nr:hypothetical protein [Clostridium rectalis]